MGDASGAEQRPHLRATLILSCLAQFMVILDVSVVNVALPSIRSALHFPEQDLQWVVNAYTVTFAGFMLLGGRAADLLGRRRVFVAGLLLFGVASLAGGVAESQGMLIAARAVQGLGGAVIAPASLSILTATFAEGGARNRAVGIWGAMGAAGGSAGVLLGGMLTEWLNWRWILFINVPIGLVAAIAAHQYIAEGRNPERAQSFDLPGAITATAGLSLLVLGIVRTSVTGWGSASTLALMAGGLALLVVFVVIEGRFATAPLMPLRIYRSRTLSAANLVVLMLGAAMFAMWFFVSLYLQQVLGLSPIQAGLCFLPMTALLATCSTLSSRMVQRFGAKTLLTTGMLLMTVGLLLFTDVAAGGSYAGDVLVPSLIVAVGMGIAFVPATLAAVSGVTPHEAGLASGLVNTSRLFGGALGLAILATIATSTTNSDLHRHVAIGAALSDGFQVAFVVAAGFALIGAVIAIVGLPRIPPRGQPAPEREPAPTDERELVAERA
ncbi:MAG TPA: MFS transporter [Solirubrobacteraceae bacterium]|nr:MFS transporter [Solirubrobacteraceae bacterium]